MKPITPVKIFTSGKFVEAVGITVISAFDNLTSEVTFEYSIYLSPNETIGGGTVTLKGDDYALWDGSEMGAYELVAQKVGFELEKEGDNVSVGT